MQQVDHDPDEPQSDRPTETLPREVFAVVRRRKWSIGLITAAIVVASLAFTYLRTPMYEATATVQVSSLNVGAGATDVSSILQQMDTEATTVTSDEIVGQAAKSLETADIDALKKQVSVSVPTGQVIMEITCTNASADRAARCANAFADAYKAGRIQEAQLDYKQAIAPFNAQINQLTQQIDELNTELAAAAPADQPAIQSKIDAAQSDLGFAKGQLSVQPRPSSQAADVTQRATVPTSPSNKDYITVGILAAILGLALGIGFAFLRERLDEDLHGVEDLERAIGAPALAVIPKIDSWHDKNEPRLVTLSAPDSEAAEAYRTARTTLQYLARTDGAKVIAIAGPGKGEGKTTTTGNLAVALARSGKRVIAVSCDLRKPRLHRFFDLDNDHGLSNLLVHSTSQTLQESLFETEIPGLTVMPSGPVPQNPAELLGSLNMDLVLDHLRDRADIVLLDTAPALVVADTLGLAPKADAIVVVVDADNTTREVVRQLRTRLDRVGGRVFACVLNDFQASHARGDDRYGYYSSKYSTKYSADGYVSTNGSNGAKTSRRDRKREAKAKQKTKPEQWR